jgi:hypothetical protein
MGRAKRLATARGSATMAVAANRAKMPRTAVKDQYSWKFFMGFSLLGFHYRQREGVLAVTAVRKRCDGCHRFLR